MAIGQTPKQTSRWRELYWLEETHRIQQAWAADRDRTHAFNVRMQRFRAATDVLGAVGGYMQTRALAGAQMEASRTGLAATLAGLDSRGYGLDVSQAMAGQRFGAVMAATEAGRTVVEAQRADLDRALEAREAVLVAAGGSVEAERGFRTQLFNARVRERQRDTRRRIGAAAAEQAGRGARGSAAWTSSIEERAAEAVDLEIRELEHRAMMAGLSQREQEIEEGKTTALIEQRTARARLDEAEVRMERQRSEAYTSLGGTLGHNVYQRRQIRAQRSAARAQHALAQKRTRWGKRLAGLKVVSSVAGVAMGGRGA